MKTPKFPYIALGLVVFFVGLTIVWFNRFDSSSDFREFRSAMGFSSLGQEEVEEDKQNTQDIESTSEMSPANQPMSEEEVEFFKTLQADYPSFEEIENSCRESFSNLNFDAIPVDGQSLNDDKAVALTDLYMQATMTMFDGPTQVFDQIVYFINDNESTDPAKFYALLNEASSLCISREVIQRLRNTIEQSHTLGWSQVAKYRLSVLIEPMLFLFQTIHTPERMLLYINTVEAMEQYGFVTFETNTSFNAIRTRLEDFHQKINAELQSPELTVAQKHQALRDYMAEMQRIAAELSETAMEGIRRPIPAS